MYKKLIGVLIVALSVVLAPSTINAQVNAQATTGVKAWVWSSQPQADTQQPDGSFSYNSSGGAVTITRKGTGDYVVDFANLKAKAAGTVHVSAYQGNHFCNAGTWKGSPVQVEVFCYDPSGARVDGRFSVLYYEETGTTTDRTGAYLLANHSSGADYVPGKLYDWNSSGGDNHITRSEIGKYEITIPGMKQEGQPEPALTVLVTAAGELPTRCSVWGWGWNGNDATVTVRCFNTDGKLADSFFTLSLMTDVVAGMAGGQGAFVNSREFKNAGAIYSSTNSAPDVTSASAGKTDVMLGGLKSESSSVAIVTASLMGDNPYYCNPNMWEAGPNSGTTVHVDCFDQSGNPIDSTFNLLYLTN